MKHLVPRLSSLVPRPSSFVLRLSSLLLLPFLCQAQSTLYHPLPSSGATWREYSGGYQSGFCADYQDFITGDTVIGGNTYTALRRAGVQYAEDYAGFCTWTIMYSFNFYNGAYRNDSINRKVYYMPAGGTTDTLLYDFNLGIGDTLPPTFLYDPNWWETSFVSGIDSILVGSEYRRRYALSTTSWTYGYLIEGIGSTSGILGRMESPFEAGSTLLCFMLGDSTVYTVNQDTADCQLVNAAPRDLKSTLTTRLNPNPADQQVRLSCPPETTDAELVIYDLFGRQLLHAGHLQNGSPVNVEALKTGLYYYRVITPDGRAGTGKIVKR